MKVKYFSDKTVKTFVVIMGVTFIGFLLKELQYILIPFVVAYLLFFLFAPLNDYLNKKGIPLSILVIFDLIIISAVIFGAGQFLIDSVMRFAEKIDEYFKVLNNIVREIAIGLGIPDAELRKFSISKLLKEQDYKSMAGDAFTYAVDLLGSILFVLFFFIFIEGGHEAIMSAFRKRFVRRRESKEFQRVVKKHPESEEGKEKVIEEELKKEKVVIEESVANTSRKITGQIQRYIITKIGMNLLAGALVTAACFILKVDFPIIWGAFTFILNFIPTIGSAFALLFPTLMALVQFKELGYGLLTAAIIALIQTLIFNLLEPKIIGKRLNLNPIVILLSVLLWGYLWGIVGMFLAVPLTAIIKIILENSRSKDSVFLADLMSQGQ